MEAVIHGVPILGIPLYGSNRQNLMKVQVRATYESIGAQRTRFNYRTRGLGMCWRRER